MASNTALIAVKDRGWLDGFGPLWRKECHSWWGSWRWLVTTLVWIAIIDGMLATVVLLPKAGVAGADQAASRTEVGNTEESPEQTALMIYFVFAGIVAAYGLVVFGHETLIDERKMGTAAWVLSKPVSRTAFLLARLSADALGVLTTMVLVQGLVAYWVYKAATGIWLPIPGFMAGLALVYLYLVFVLALTLMLGTLFHSRVPVIGVAMATVSSGFVPIFLPWLATVMPSTLVLSLGSGRPSLAEALAQGHPPSTLGPIIVTGLLVILFIAVAVVRFQREEF